MLPLRCLMIAGFAAVLIPSFALSGELGDVDATCLTEGFSVAAGAAASFKQGRKEKTEQRQPNELAEPGWDYVECFAERTYTDGMGRQMQQTVGYAYSQWAAEPISKPIGEVCSKAGLEAVSYYCLAETYAGDWEFVPGKDSQVKPSAGQGPRAPNKEDAARSALDACRQANQSRLHEGTCEAGMLAVDERKVANGQCVDWRKSFDIHEVLKSLTDDSTVY